MKFYFPFWFEDQICEGYNPWVEKCPNPDDRKFIWQIGWKHYPFDGILISRPNLEAKPDWLKKCNRCGITESLKIPPTIPTFGDCGAWWYIDEKEPPYDPLETLDFYARMRFTMACTVDHIILPKTMGERHRRLGISLNNAEKMISKWSSNRDRYKYNLVGVVQGWDPQSYHQAAKEIIDMGFDYIALGGQARSPSITTEKILHRCSGLWKDKHLGVHVFGIARKNLFEAYRKYGVTSFDNAYHRRAWMSATNNYEIGDKAYTAIRIPIKKTGAEPSRLEISVFTALRRQVEGEITSDRFLGILRSYEEKLKREQKSEGRKPRTRKLEGVKRFSLEYDRTLRDKPWMKCDCPMCRIGVHICVFRGNQRNMRRGFHNLWNFYNVFQSFNRSPPPQDENRSLGNWLPSSSISGSL